MATFLELNGYSLEVANQEIVMMMEGIAMDLESQDSLAVWLEENSVSH